MLGLSVARCLALHENATMRSTYVRTYVCICVRMSICHKPAAPRLDMVQLSSHTNIVVTHTPSSPMYGCLTSCLMSSTDRCELSLGQ